MVSVVILAVVPYPLDARYDQGGGFGGGARSPFVFH